jgi:hypothetical protein
VKKTIKHFFEKKFSYQNFKWASKKVKAGKNASGHCQALAVF